MEERIAILERKLEALEKNFETYLSGDIDVTNTLTSFMSGNIDFRNRYEIEYNDILKNLEILSDSVSKLTELRKGDVELRELYKTLHNLK